MVKGQGQGGEKGGRGVGAGRGRKEVKGWEQGGAERS